MTWSLNGGTKGGIINGWSLAIIYSTVVDTTYGRLLLNWYRCHSFTFLDQYSLLTGSLISLHRLYTLSFFRLHEAP